MPRPALHWLAASIAVLSLPAAADDDRRGPHRLPQLPAAQPASLQGSCESLLTRLQALPNTTLLTATTVAAGTLTAAGTPVPEHCRVTGQAYARPGATPATTFAIGFEMRLPRNWNGRFFHQGNGGIDGSVNTALGATGGGPRTHALLQGFAVLSSDAGHNNPVNGFAAFGLDPQARLDYGYQAVGKLTPIAKQAIALAYGKGPDRSYFGGCSNGGRHTLIAAARYADQYDGFLAGAPGYRLPLAALANIWGAQQYAKVAVGTAPVPPTGAWLESAYTLAERKAVSNAVLARCDALDGAVDGMVQATSTCQKVFDFMRDVPTCGGGARDGNCLTQAQKLAIGPIYSGATLKNGQPFYASFPFDAGHGTAGVATWEFNNSLNLDSGAVGVIFKVPPTAAALTGGPAFSLGLDIDAAYGQLFATDGTYGESAMSFMTPPDASSLDDVRRRGAKILVYHGVSDAIFSVNDTERWYRNIDKDSGGKAADFARFYRVPGMGHCSGGPSTDQADFLGPLVAWVEGGKAPAAITASARGPGNPGGVNGDVPATWAPDRTRPLCPFPGVARYSGSGDVERAENWACAGPLQGKDGD